MPAAPPSRQGPDTAHTIQSTPEAVRGLLATLMRDLSTADVPDGACGMVELVLAEALNNVVEHAYRGAPGGVITVHTALRGNVLSLRITDDGAPLPGGALPHPDDPALPGPRADLPEGGFGWRLIHALTTRLDYTRTGGRNRLTLDFDLDHMG